MIVCVCVFLDYKYAAKLMLLQKYSNIFWLWTNLEPKVKLDCTWCVYPLCTRMHPNPILQRRIVNNWSSTKSSPTNFLYKIEDLSIGGHNNPSGNYKGLYIISSTWFATKIIDKFWKNNEPPQIWVMWELIVYASTKTFWVYLMDTWNFLQWSMILQTYSNDTRNNKDSQEVSLMTASSLLWPCQPQSEQDKN